VCGACTVLIDGAPARSCITFAVACEGARITTIEGLDDDPIAAELRTAFSREHALQCGYCTPGMLISARDVVLRLDTPSERDIRVAMSGNLCRCTGYVGIIKAVESVLAARRAAGTAAVAGAGRTALGPVGSGHAAATEGTGAAVRARVSAAPVSATRREAQTGFIPQASFEQSFVVAHPREKVWAFFGDVPAVASCLPGASLTGEPADGHVSGKMRVKVGPMAAEFQGAAEISRDPSTWSGTIIGSGRDSRSDSATRGRIAYRLSPADDPQSTRVDVTVGYALTGAFAQFSRAGLTQDIANRMTQTFVQNLEARLAGRETAPQAAELNAGALFFSALGGRVKAWFRRLFGR
jgi:carbon-monoxide dehydrogenase small subunit